MIPEFYMYSAEPIDSGKRVTGHLCMRHAKDGNIDDYVFAIQLKDDPSCFIQIQYDTIEPIKVKPIKKFNSYFCPNCEWKVFEDSDDNKYCRHCGMALDWHDTGQNRN